MANETFLHIRLDEALKNQAAAAFAENGLTLSEGIRLVLTKVAKTGAIPPEFILTRDDFKNYIIKLVEEAWADSRPLLPHEQVVKQLDGLIAEKRRKKRSELA
jgi:DNA-damage-inducible protein J